MNNIYKISKIAQSALLHIDEDNDFDVNTAWGKVQKSLENEILDKIKEASELLSLYREMSSGSDYLKILKSLNNAMTNLTISQDEIK